MKALVVRQPWASLIAHGIKTIETRGFAPRTVLAPGDQLAIVAGKATPDPMVDLGRDWRVVYESDPFGEMDTAWAVTHRTGGYHLTPLGAVVAVVTYDGAALCIDWDNLPDPPVPPDRIATFKHEGDLAHQQGGLWLTGPSRMAPCRIEDQRPLGDFTPGRYGWLLSNPQRLNHPVPCPAKRPDGTPNGDAGRVHAPR